MSIIPPTQKTWRLQTQDGWEKGLVLIENENVPHVSGNDVLVKFYAASLNYRDLIIAKGTSVVSKMRPGVVPGSDGAGEVIAIGDKVGRFMVGDRVVTLFNQGHFSGELDSGGVLTGVGGMVDGTLRQYGVFNEQGLVSMPKSLSYLEASTLSCAAVTAWNALFGGRKQLKPGSTILTQGTGGVSLFAFQLALSAGATVIATTSSPSKTTLLKSLGATHVINYKETPNWGDVVKGLTYKGEGVDFVVEVGGPSTMGESLKAVRIGGVVNLIGVVAGRGGNVKDSGREVGFLDILARGVTVRGIMVGGRDLLVEMIKAIDENQIKPVIDEKIFGLEELKEAYQYMSESKHVGKVVVRIV